jgi:hypothetical protein
MNMIHPCPIEYFYWSYIVLTNLIPKQDEMFILACIKDDTDGKTRLYQIDPKTG